MDIVFSVDERNSKSGVGASEWSEQRSFLL